MTDTPGPNNPRNEPLPHTSAVQAPNLTKYIVASVLLIIPCGNVLFGVLGLVFTFLAKSDYENGKFSDGQSKKKVAKILLIVGYVLLAVAIAVALIGTLFAGWDYFFTEGVNLSPGTTGGELAPNDY